MTNPDREELVKPLVWGKSRTTDEVGLMAQDAYTSIGHYIASDNGWFLLGQSEWNASASLDTAKAAAQSDYEARIKSALVEVPAVKGEPEPVAWIDFADSGNVRLWTSEKSRAAAEIASGRKMTPVYTAQPADAGMREALELAHGKFCKIAGTEAWTDSCLDGWRRSPGALRDYAEQAAKEIDASLTAPGATTKSDGGAKAGSSPILASKEEQRPDTHGMMPVGDNAANIGSTGVGPSDALSTYTIAHDGFTGTVQGHYVTREGKQGVVLQQVGTRVVHVYGRKWIDGNTTSDPSSTRSEVTVLTKRLDQVLKVMRGARNRSEPMAVWADDIKAVEDVRALLDQFEIRRK